MFLPRAALHFASYDRTKDCLDTPGIAQYQSSILRCFPRNDDIKMVLSAKTRIESV